MIEESKNKNAITNQSIFDIVITNIPNNILISIKDNNFDNI